MMWITLILLSVCGLCDSQELNSSCSGREDCKECIGDYVDLELYINNNSAIVKTLAKTFFATGNAAAKFVRITYKFRTKKGVEGGNTNCSRTSQQNTYVWSENSFYFLGPNALFWWTLTAINIEEADVTIELPCLCRDAYKSLLSQLTYMVCVHSS